MKKLSLILISILLLLTLAACGDKCDEHVYDDCTDKRCNICGYKRDSLHTWANATCTTPKTCTVCGTTDGTALGHTFEDDGNCLTAQNCTVCEQEAVASCPEHTDTDTDDDWTCDNLGCEYLFPGTLGGLTFTPNEDNASYSITGTIEGFKCVELTIPATVNGKPVTSIGKKAFDNCRSLMSVTIPDSVTSIGEWAFIACLGLENVIFDANSKLTTIGDSAFYLCTALTSVTIPASVTTIDDNAFNRCTKLTSVTFGKNSQLTTIGDAAFYGCTALTSVTIPDSVTTIGDAAFRETALTSVVIPDSVTTIGNLAFFECTALTSIYYGGTDENTWTTLSAKAGFYGNPTVYYYSETKPEGNGNYWHYDANGVPSTFA